jgi:NADH-quinone oxidoreductase subunit G
VIAVDSVLTDTIREHADVVFPAEAYAEKEGTLTHPDGRVQRLRPAIGRPRGADARSGSGVRPLWQVIADVAGRTGLELGVRTGPMASQLLFDAVPFYAGLTLDAIGGRGIRWPVTEAAAAFGATPWEPAKLDVPDAVPATTEGALRLGTFRSLWSSKEVDVSPALRFLRPRQVVELSPTDAERLGIIEGDQVEVGSNGTRVTGAVKLRAAVPGGSVFIAEGTHEQPANALTDAMVEVRKV